MEVLPDPRGKRGRRHVLAGLLAAGIAAVIAGSRSFTAIGQWAADAGPDVLAALGADRGPAEESACRRAFALVSADVLDRSSAPGCGPRRCGPAVGWSSPSTARPYAARRTRTPHLVAALAHGIGAVLGQVAVDAKSNEIPAVRDLLKTFADLAGAVVTIDAMHTQADTAQLILGRGGRGTTAGHWRQQFLDLVGENGFCEHGGLEEFVADVVLGEWRSTC